MRDEAEHREAAAGDSERGQRRLLRKAEVGGRHTKCMRSQGEYI